MVLLSDGVEVHLHTFHVRPWHNRLELVDWVSSGQQAIILCVCEKKFGRRKQTPSDNVHQLDHTNLMIK